MGRRLATWLGAVLLAVPWPSAGFAQQFVLQQSDEETIQYLLETLPDGIQQPLPSGDVFMIVSTDRGRTHACRNYVVLRHGYGDNRMACRDPQLPIWTTGGFSAAPQAISGPLTVGQVVPQGVFGGPPARPPMNGGGMNGGGMDGGDLATMLAIGAVGALAIGAAFGGGRMNWDCP